MTPTGATCSGAVAFYGAGSGTACSSDYLATYNTATPCGPVSRSAFHSIFVGGSSFTGGTCTRAGGAPTGSVTPTMPTTFCCLP